MAATVCTNQSGVGFTAAEVAGASSYVWSVPSGAVITEGEGTRTITVDFGTSSGLISAAAVNECGTGPGISVSVKVKAIPQAPGAVSGPEAICASDPAGTYSIEPVPGATEYVWTVPESAQITAGQGSTVIEVVWGGEGGEVSVMPLNECGDQGSSVLAVEVEAAPGQPGALSGGVMVWPGARDLV